MAACCTSLARIQQGMQPRRARQRASPRACACKYRRHTSSSTVPSARIRTPHNPLGTRERCNRSTATARGTRSHRSPHALRLCVSALLCRRHTRSSICSRSTMSSRHNARDTGLQSRRAPHLAKGKPCHHGWLRSQLCARASDCHIRMSASTPTMMTTHLWRSLARMVHYCTCPFRRRRGMRRRRAGLYGRRP